MSAGTDKATTEVQLQALIETAGLQNIWNQFPQEVRESHALAATYVAMLPADIDPQVAPWVFPGNEAAS